MTLILKQIHNSTLIVTQYLTNGLILIKYSFLHKILFQNAFVFGTYKQIFGKEDVCLRS